MKIHLIITAGSVASMLLALPTAPIAAPGSQGVLVPWLLVASQYRYDGISASDNHPVIQGSLYWWRPDKSYAGLFVSGVDYKDPGKTSFEVDYYAGHHFDFKGTEVTTEAMYSTFPDNGTPGPTYDFLQLKLKAKRRFDRWTLGGEGDWTPEAPYRAGVSWRAAGEAAYTLRPGLTLSGKVGHIWRHQGYDRSFWELSAKSEHKTFDLELRYIGTDLHRSQCGYGAPPWCGPAFVAAATYKFAFSPLGR